MATRSAGVTTMTIAGVNRPVRSYVRVMSQTTEKQPIYGLSGFQGYSELPIPVMLEISTTDLGDDNGAFIKQIEQLGTDGRTDRATFTEANGNQNVAHNVYLVGQHTKDLATGEITFTLAAESYDTV